eukprot:COSAG06_NODE_48608_length_331_cov_0.353448_1_plen_80_part_10
MREAAVLDSEFRAESESGLRSAQSPAGKDEKFSQSPAAEMRCVLAGWLLAGEPPCSVNVEILQAISYGEILGSRGSVLGS